MTVITTTVRRNRLGWCTLAAAAVFVTGLVFGLFAPAESATGVLGELGQLIEPLRNAGPFVLLVVIVLNNALKALGAVVMGVVVGLPPAVFLVLNGYLLGIVVTGFTSVSGLAYVMASLIPHGVIEIPLLLLAAGLGFSVGWEVIRWLAWRTGAVKAQMRMVLGLYLRWVLPGLAIAALVEVFLTPLVVALVSGGSPG
ncbi:MAG: stage II sporulation protein M [Chloroflexota bacterium]